jgi:hypothetical protein
MLVNGNVYGSGWNTDGRLGDGSLTSKSLFVGVYMGGAMAGKKIAKISGNSLMTMALATGNSATIL